MNLKTTLALHAKALFRGIPILGFSRPDEENVRAMLSRIPPELYFNVKRVVAAPELGVKHGRFTPENKTIYLNPKTFQLRQRFGKGPGWVWHVELVVIHEVGHSIFDALSEEKRQAWYVLSGWKKGAGEGQAPVYVEKRSGWPEFTSEWTHKKGVKFARKYSEKSPDEDFADAMAFVLMNKPFQAGEEKRQFIQCLLNTLVTKYPQTYIFGPDTAVGERRWAYKSKTV